MILQTRASHLSAHDLRLFSTIHSGLVTKCDLRMYSSISLLIMMEYIVLILYVPVNNLAHVSHRLKVSYCDLTLPGERQSVHKTFALE